MRNRIPAALLTILAVIVSARSSAQPSPDRVRIPLDSTGISDWTYLNPANVPAIGNRAVEFYNTTPDRTFVVTMPFIYTSAEFNRAFATARLQRGSATMADVVCRVFSNNLKSAYQCDLATTDALERVEELRVLMESLEAVGDEPPNFATCNAKSPACLVERLYWSATCKLCAANPQPRDREGEFQTLLENEATALLMHLIRDSAPPDVPFCSIVQALALREELPDGAAAAVSCAPLPPPKGAVGTLDTAIDENGAAAIKKQFASERTKLAKAALMEAVTKELNATLNLREVEAVRRELQTAFNSVREPSAEAIGAAANLLRSYSPESPVPFRLPTGSWTSDGTFNHSTVTSAAFDQDVAIGNCDRADGKVKCAAVATIRPGHIARFSLGTLQHNPNDIISFNVSFFGQTTLPPNANAYVRLREKKEKELVTIPAKFAIGLGMDGQSAYDLTNDFVSHNRHTIGGGTTAIEFTGGIFDSSVSLQFKQGDFGGDDSTRAIKVAEYQAKVFGARNLTVQFGQFLFARPSSGIALAERGEGVLLAYKKLAGSYIIHRGRIEADSTDDSVTTKTDDYYVGLLQAKNLTLPNFRSLDGTDLTFAYGKNKNSQPQKQPFTFLTFGAETRLTFTSIQNTTLTAAAYHSERHAGSLDPDTDVLTDGRGTVGLLSWGWNWSGSAPLFEKTIKSRPAYGPTFTVARGSGDNSSTSRDEGYLGETAGFANDVIFLSQISKSDLYQPVIGRGLENKWYGGIRWSDARASFLALIAGLLGTPESVASRATIASLHVYRFSHPVNGSTSGGIEGNLEFQVESPKSVTWSLKGAYYHRSRAIELAGLVRDPWQIVASVSLKLQGP
ncbi:MAG TPA: hypothetical protein VGR02_19135 [Thermoanaerobaculia bacterium]|jgi:hypothetical protein|nr:hypothetical protein [Thermoanaerobaculia bacterium]